MFEPEIFEPPKVSVFKIHPDAVFPQRQSEEAIGFDLHTIEDFSLFPGQRIVVGTGLVMQPPQGYHMEILIRSSMAFKHNIMLINGVGLIDRDYAGPEDELKLMFYRAPEFSRGNLLKGPKAASFKKGDRVAQVVFRKSEVLDLAEVREAPGKTRGGLGSTGK